MSSPRSRLDDGRLLVDGAPFTVLGVELHNSSASTPVSIDAAWVAVARSGANTVLAPVAWDQWEPTEGVFDTRLVDHLLAVARAGGQRLILLWFGSWKNGVSSYTPAWVKRDPHRFPLARRADGEPLMALSTLADANAAADARAFASLMSHLREADAEHGTVVMVQVENEVGLLGTARDHGALAERAWRQRPPARFGLDAWADADADVDRAGEMFMAWHYGRYVDTVAEAGKREWPLPMYVNAWLDGDEDANPMAGGTAPGDFPSGGPVPRMLEIWRAAAPSVDFAAPDVYAGDVFERASSYDASFGMQFIPEMRRDSPAQLFRALGRTSAIGMAAFGVDSASDGELARIARAYAQLSAVAEVAGTGERAAFHLDDDRPRESIALDGVTFEIERDFDPQGEGDLPDGYGLLVACADGFLLCGSGVVLTPRRADGSRLWVESCVEVARADDGLVPARVLNGDETGGGTHIRITRDDPPGFGPVPIAASRTGILSFRLYAAGADSR
ncbi:DUF5597 domain-containing protein [Microbacterium awajiense]|uniref:DUF5597 domain-containing protein n=1 Tax=Microbacterium awajiense TaxID=415214 RepID=A0ABP7AVQ0_9MICO